MPSAIAPEKINASGLIGSVHRNLGTANETRVAGIAILDKQLRYVEVNEALAAINGNVVLGDAVDDRADSRPHAGAGAHGAGFVRGVEHEVRQVAAITA